MKSTRESLWAVEPSDRPREKLERLGPRGLTDSELVALVLGSGMPGVNVLDSAASLLAQAGGVHELMVMSVSELKALLGVGVATAGRVVAVAELWRRAHDPLPGARITTPNDLVDVVRAFLALRTPPPSSAVEAPPYGPMPARGSAPPGRDAPRAPTASAGSGRWLGGDALPSAVVAAAPTWPSDARRRGAAPYVVVTDEELRVLVVVPVPWWEGESIPSLVPRVLHEVLYRGGSAFALAVVEHPVAEVGGAAGVPGAAGDAGVGDHLTSGAEVRLGDDDELRAVRDVLKLAATTVGLRYLSTVVIAGEAWSTCD